MSSAERAINGLTNKACIGLEETLEKSSGELKMVKHSTTSWKNLVTGLARDPEFTLPGNVRDQNMQGVTGRVIV